MLGRKYRVNSASLVNLTFSSFETFSYRPSRLGQAVAFARPFVAIDQALALKDRQIVAHGFCRESRADSNGHLPHPRQLHLRERENDPGLFLRQRFEFVVRT